jgi:hypothetical protein
MASFNQLIQPRFPELTVRSDVGEADLKKHELAALLALNFIFEPLKCLIENPTEVALAQIQQIVRVDPAVLASHKSNFPDKYIMPQNISTFLLVSAAQLASKAQAQRSQFDVNAARAIAFLLIKSGANPLPILARPSVTAPDIDNYLDFSPPDARRDINGFTLGHAHCLAPDFFEKLPVLLKHKVDLNSVDEAMRTGTLTHQMLANEQFDKVVTLIKSPFARKVLDFTKRDGEDKTIPIMAAKVRAEKVLLALADRHYSYEEDSYDKLALDARDDQGRTVMHYIFALGLLEAARRYIKYNPNLEIKDNQGHTAKDCLSLSEEETREILLSIELHPDRDAAAFRNAIQGEEGQPVLIDQCPILSIKDNFTYALTTAARKQFGEKGLKFVKLQKKRMQGISLLDEVLQSREQLKNEFENGLLAPKKGQRNLSVKSDTLES